MWSWVRAYLTDRTQVTNVNRLKSEVMPVRFGVPQGSVLGPTLLSLCCNDLPDIANGGEGEIHMYADDTTICVAASCKFCQLCGLSHRSQLTYLNCKLVLVFEREKLDSSRRKSIRALTNTQQT